MQLDDWQKEYIEYKGHKILVSGRQTGKSEAASIDNGEFAVKNPGVTCLIISKTERQADELLLKTLRYVGDNYKSMICKGLKKPTKSKFELTNGSKVISLPVGVGGEGVRYLTAHKLTVDEAQLPPDDVFTAVTPMLLTTGGSISLLGTPQGRQGYFYECYLNKMGHFKVFHVNSEEVIKNRPISASWPEWRRKAALDHLEQEQARMTKKQYMQEYLGIFVEDLNNFFPIDLIRSCMKPRGEIFYEPKNTFLNSPVDVFGGLDVARMGKNETVLISVKREGREIIKMKDMVINRKTYLTDTADLILMKDRQFKFRKIYIDSAGVGAGVYDFLLKSTIKHKIIPIENATKSLNTDGTKKKRLLKEDLYNNLKVLMERGKIEIFDDPEIFMSLKGVQFEYTDKGNLIIYGEDDHIVEALARACWCVQDKGLNVWAR